MSILQITPSLQRKRPQHWQPAPASSPRGILIVDDDEMVRTLLGLYFRQHDIPVWLASDGAEALELYQSVHDSIGVVLLDADMPDADGQHALACLQHLGAQAAFYLMTEAEPMSTEVSFQAIEAAELLRKPFFFKVLAKSVRQSLRDAEAMVDLNAIVRFARPYLRELFGDLVQCCSPRAAGC